MNRSTLSARPHCARARRGGLTPTPRRTRGRQGFTLIEMLVSLAITLIMMGAVVTLFGVVSDSVSASRSLIEISDRLRSARETLQQDLQGLTCPLTPPLRPENNQGYFELSEGPMNDGMARANGLSGLFGDLDDVLMFTTSRPDAPFIGRAVLTPGGNPVTIESPNAEVIYFVVQDGPIIDATTTPATRLCSLYRRVRLIAPQVGPTPLPSDKYFTDNDVSARFETIPGNDSMVPNTLGDLTKRENRFAHYGLGTFGQFPFLFDWSMLPGIETTPTVQFIAPTAPTPLGNWPSNHPTENAFLRPFDVNTPRFGDDRLLTNVLAFDVQVYDPDAPVVIDTTTGLAIPSNTPTSSNYTSLIGSAVAAGDYVDLGYVIPAGITTLPLGRVVDPRSGINGPLIYDTWSEHYENDGLDRLGNSIDASHPGDLATNGLDDDTQFGVANGLVDDDDERDTLPPYRVPLRGIRVTIRVYETSSKQVREAVVVQNFSTK